MKHNYLYQGWAGNTYSHKCNSLNSSCLYFKLKRDVSSNDAVMSILVGLTTGVLIKKQNMYCQSPLVLIRLGEDITRDELRAFKIDLPCFVVDANNPTIAPADSVQEAFKNIGMNIDDLLEEITEAEYNSIRDNMIKELLEEALKPR